MRREFYSSRSEILGEDMSMIVYGEGGYPVIAFQTQDSKSNNFEDFGMIDVLAPFIDEGRIQVFSVDNLDEQSWSDEGGDKGARAWRQEQYFQFVTDELVPRVHAWNNSDRRPIAVGCSMGATHAAIAALRRPDLFQGCIALSGVYSTSFFFGDYMDDNLYNNDVPAFLTNMPADHPYVDLYNQRQLVLCVGQGAWEMGLDDLRYIDGQLNRLGAKHWCDFWGLDVNHDWPWWRKQMPYFMNEVLVEIENAAKGSEPATVVEEPKAEAAPEPEAKVEAEPKAEAAAPKEEPKAEAPKAAAKKAPAKRTTTRKATAAKATAAKKTAAAAEKAPAAAEEKAVERAAEDAPKAEAEAPKAAAKKAPTKRAATHKATAAKATAAKMTTAAAEKAPAAAEATAVEAPKAEAEAAKPAAKRTTTRKAATAKAATASKKAASDTATTAEAAPKATTRKATTRRTATKKAQDAE